MGIVMLKLGWRIRQNQASALKGIGFRTCRGNHFPLFVKSDTILNGINFRDQSDGSRTFAIPSKSPALFGLHCPIISTSGSWSSSSPDLWCRNLTYVSDPLTALDLSLPQPQERKMLICLEGHPWSLEWGQLSLAYLASTGEGTVRRRGKV